MFKIIRLLTAGFIMRLLETTHISWYSSRLTYLLVGKFEIDVFDTFLFVTLVIFLLFMVWKQPELESKPKKWYLIIKYVFHVAFISYILWEGYHTHNYPRMGLSLLFYFLVEILIRILHHLNKKCECNKGSPLDENKKESKQIVVK